MAHGRDIVAGRKFLDHLDIAGQPGARKDAFEQIMAEQGRVRHPPGQRRLESIDIVNALACERAFVEQVLIDVRDRRRVGIDAALGGKYPLEQRAALAHRQGGGDARLQDAIARHDPARHCVIDRPVERMRHLANQPGHSFKRQARVGIERDHIGNAGWCLRLHAIKGNEAGVRHSAQKAVELMQFAALALPTDPGLLACAPFAGPVQQQETRSGQSRRITFVEAVDASDRCIEKGRIARQGLLRRIGPVRQQRKIDFALGAGQVVHFKGFDMFGHTLRRGQQGRNGHKRAQAGWNACRQFQPRQNFGSDAMNNCAIDQGNGRIADRHGQQQTQKRQPGTIPCLPQQKLQGNAKKNGTTEKNAGDIACDAEPAQAVLDAVCKRGPIADGFFKRRAPCSGQTIAATLGAACRLRHCQTGDVHLAGF